MKILLKYLSVVIIATIVLVSCKPSESKATQSETSLPVKLETVSLNIEGMTCEIGCAKTIESKVSKIEGVTDSKVEFKSKKGTFSFDANKVSEANIISTINNLLDGKTYKATKNKTCCSIAKDEKSCTEVCAKKCGHKIGEVCKKCTSNTGESCCASDKKEMCKSNSTESCCNTKSK